MKKYIRKALILFVACIVLYATLDFIFRELTRFYCFSNCSRLF